MESSAFIYRRLQRQKILRGFGCVDKEYPEKSVDISPIKLTEITGLDIESLTPKERTNYWRLAGVSLCLIEYLIGTNLGIDPLLTTIPATFLLLISDQIFLRGAAFESIYQKLFPEYKKKIIYHEAGHFLLAYLLGVSVRGCVTNAWEARKYPDIKGQAGTIFYDSKLAEEMSKEKVFILIDFLITLLFMTMLFFLSNNDCTGHAVVIGSNMCCYYGRNCCRSA